MIQSILHQSQLLRDRFNQPSFPVSTPQRYDSFATLSEVDWLWRKREREREHLLETNSLALAVVKHNLHGFDSLID
jgi:hypothetical protein